MRLRRWDLVCSAVALAAGSAALVVAGAGASGCGGCALAYCSSGVSITVDWPSSYAELQSAQVTMCRNTTCLTVELSKLDQTPSIGVLAQAFSSFANPQMMVTVHAAADGNLWLGAGWAESGDSPFSEGDVFTLIVVDASGNTVISETETVSAYQILRPNGPDCVPICQQASFDLRSPN